MRQLGRWYRVGAVACSLMFATSVAVFAKAKVQHDSKAEQSGQKPVSVEVETVQTATVEGSIKALGTLAPSEEVQLSFNASGHLTKINYKNGQYVKKGSVIAELNSDSERANLRSLQADAEVKKLDYERYLKLSKIGGVSDQQLDKEHASMVQAEAQVESAKVDLAQRQLVAPFTGFLGEFQFNHGAYVGTGDKIVRLVSISPLKVNFSVPQNQKSKLLLGQSVNITSDAIKRTVTGLVQFISPTVNTDTGTITIEASVPNKDYKLSPGMYVKVEQLLGNQHQVLTIPETAVSVDEKGPSVYVIDQNIAHFTRVELGARTGGTVEVLKGLKAGQKVVIAGVQKLKNKMPVDVIEPKPKAKPKVAPAAKPTTPSTHKQQSNVTAKAKV